MSQKRRELLEVQPGRPPVIAPGHTFGTVTDKISSIVLNRKTPLYWFIPFAIAMTLVLLFLVAVTYLFVRGVGIWGIKIPIGWGWAITNFVWWIGIGHAGTLISAILLLLHQSWRNSINRFARAAYGILAMGWRGAASHWQKYETASLLLAGLATPLVISVHTVVSFDFAVAIVPGWHSTIFPPYFVAGAIYSGFAMVLVLAIPLRALYGLHDLITMRHLDNCAKVMLATAEIVAYSYIFEAFIAWYSGNTFEMFAIWNRMTGPYWPTYWLLIFCNLVAPQLLWVKKYRTNV